MSTPDSSTPVMFGACLLLLRFKTRQQQATKHRMAVYNLSGTSGTRGFKPSEKRESQLESSSQTWLNMEKNVWKHQPEDEYGWICDWHRSPTKNV